MMNVQTYLNNLNLRFKTGISREHTYRGDLQNLLMAMLPEILVTNEPSRISCGAPDYVLTRKDIPVGYIEAKDIGVDLKSKSLKEQFDRYREGLNNLIFTDYLDFHFYKDGVLTTSVAIAKIEQGNIIPLPQNFDSFTTLIINFAQTVSQTIKSPTKLAQMMAGKAKLMADVIEKSLVSDDENDTRSALKSQMLSFKQMLIHDINNQAFADIYAQTIAYGMFAARYHDPTLPTFSRQEAATLIPKSNPFLRKLFQDIAGYDLDDRLVWIVDELVNIFLATDVADIMKNFGKSTKQEDPVVHFYETFLAAYNPALRKARGVWYTPQPVVNFIVRAVDDILKTEFNLPQGLADNSKITVPFPSNGGVPEGRGGKEIHRVQILDPATGTGTFLAEVVKHIYQKFKGQQGIWSNYVNQHLIPRLNGFELLMASYAMAHLKMDMLLTETGYKATTDQRFRIFLTNSLEEAHPDSGTLFSSWLSDEADQANAVKRDSPVMVIMGNPPYSVSSTNKSEWIEKLIADYKKNLNERNIQPLSDDYIKFIRFGQHYIDKNGSGILAFISNNSFLDGIIHKQMRKHLLESFDKIYVLDLHGNSKKKETALDGSIDQNVFDIMQGVSINIFIKSERIHLKSEILHFDVYGKREYKYDFLNNNCLKSILWKNLEYQMPDYFFVKKDFHSNNEYLNFVKLDKLFNKYSAGIQTKRDALFVDENSNDLENRIVKLLNKTYDSNFITKFNINDSSSYKLTSKIKELSFSKMLICKIHYRPFDDKYIYYDSNLIGRAFYTTMSHLNKPSNLGLIVSKQFNDEFKYVMISNKICDMNLISNAGSFGAGFSFPLYLYPETNTQLSIGESQTRTPNLNEEIVNQIAERAGLYFQPEKPDYTQQTEETNQFYPIDLLDYIYAVLHSPAYREKYKEFLKIDFPRVPYPTNPKQFYDLVNLGSQLRELHLLESPETENYITQYPIDGDNVVIKPYFVNSPPLVERQLATLNSPPLEGCPQGGVVYINDTQYFANVPLTAWEFYIGGYQPAQKWLKDRKGRSLQFEDILHYQKIIVALKRTSELMVEIDGVLEV